MRELLETLNVPPDPLAAAAAGLDPRPAAEGASTPPKALMLAANARRLGRYDAVVTPERTTALLRKLGVRDCKLVYTQHGAGDRGGPFEPRLKQFDLVMAAGPKQRDRMLDEGWVTPQTCAMVGYPKFDIIDALPASPLPVFPEAKPLVLYNPHFHPTLGSWPKWGRRILEQFAADERYNLIFAPHIRLFEGADPQVDRGPGPVHRPSAHPSRPGRAGGDRHDLHPRGRHLSGRRLQPDLRVPAHAQALPVPQRQPRRLAGRRELPPLALRPRPGARRRRRPARRRRLGPARARRLCRGPEAGLRRELRPARNLVVHARRPGASSTGCR